MFLHQSHQDKFFHNQWKKILNESNCFYLTSHRNSSDSRDTYLKMLKRRHSSTLMSVFHLPSLLIGIYFPTSADKVRHKSNDWSSNYLIQSESHGGRPGCFSFSQTRCMVYKGKRSDIIKWKATQVISHDGFTQWSRFRINLPRPRGHFSSQWPELFFFSTWNMKKTILEEGQSRSMKSRHRPCSLKFLFGCTDAWDTEMSFCDILIWLFECHFFCSFVLSVTLIK